MISDEDFTAFVSARWPVLLRAAILLGCSAHEAEDLAQTTLARCYSKWEAVSRASERDAYVYRILVNSWTKSRRRRWWGEDPTAQLPEPLSADASDAVLVRGTLQVALDRLSSEHRTVLVLRFYTDLSERETAQVLGIPEGTVKSRTARALSRLSNDEHLTDLPGHRSTPC